VGWAPLPPEVRYRAGFGIDLGSVDLDVVIRQDTWCFVDESRVFEPHVGRHAYPVGRNVTLLGRTKRALRIDVDHDRIVNRGPDDEGLERRLGRAVPRYRIVDDEAVRGGEPVIRRDEVHMWRPAASEAPESSRPRRAFGRPESAPGPERRLVDEEPGPVAPAPPAVERRIDRGWERDWQRLQQIQEKEDPPRSSAPRRTPPPSPAPSPPPSLEQKREENYRAAENAYREQQAQRARARREAEQPRPAPRRQGRPANPESKPEKDEEQDGEQKKDDSGPTD
jgi:hypothetical protein